MKPWTYVVAAVVAMVAGAWAMRGWDAAHNVQKEIVARTDTVRIHDVHYVTDTLLFTRTLKVEKARRDTLLLHLTDTVEVLRYVAQTDSTIRACRNVIQDCEQRVADRDKLIAAYKKLKPSRISLGIQATCGVGLAARADCVLGVGGSWAIIR